MRLTVIALGMLFTVAAVADSSADAVMLRKKPARSFLEDVAPVKVIKDDAPKPAPAATEQPKAEPAPAPVPAAAEAPTPAPKAEPAPAVTEETKPAPAAAEEPKADLTVEKAAEPSGGAKTEAKKDGKDKKAKKADKDKKKPSRDAIITADRTDYDRKEGVVLFDRNVYVDDEQYQMHADRLFLFLDGTNDLKRLVAIGHVAITNEEKNAACSRAVYTKRTSKIVMYGADGDPASLCQGGKRGSTVKGERITFWLNSEQVEIEKPVVTVPGGSFKGGDAKGLFKNMRQ